MKTSNRVFVSLLIACGLVGLSPRVFGDAGGPAPMLDVTFLLLIFFISKGIGYYSIICQT